MATKGHHMQTTILLNAIDNVMPRYFATFILTFALKPGTSFKDLNNMLQTSLDQTCETIAILRSRIFPVVATDESSPKWRLEAHLDNVCGPQVLLNDLSKTWPDYEELVESGLRQDTLDRDQLVPKSDISSLLSAEGAPALLLQANYIDGGLLLAFSFFHSVLDGMSAMLFVKLWAQNARGLQGAHDPSKPILTIQPDAHDRTILDRIWAEEKRRTTLVSDTSSPTQMRLLGLLPADLPEEIIPSETEKPEPVVMSSDIFYISAESLKALSSKCIEPSLSTMMNTTKVTANDAIMALIWRSTIRARAMAAGPSSSDYKPDEITHLDTTLDGRALIPELPWNYMGTLIYIVTTSMSIGDLLSFDRGLGLRLAARNIRHAVTEFTRHQALEAYGVAAGLEDYGPGTLRHPFATLRGSEVCISSISSLSPSELSFGRKFFANSGHPDFVRPPLLEFGSLCRRPVVLPLQPSGGIEILIELPQEEMSFLKADHEFGEYAKVCG